MWQGWRVLLACHGHRHKLAQHKAISASPGFLDRCRSAAIKNSFAASYDNENPSLTWLFTTCKLQGIIPIRKNGCGDNMDQRNKLSSYTPSSPQLSPLHNSHPNFSIYHHQVVTTFSTTWTWVGWWRCYCSAIKIPNHCHKESVN